MGLPGFIRFLGSEALGPIPNAVIIFGSMALVMGFILSKTTLGRSIYAVGGNPTSAFLSGVKVDQITIFSYMLCGFLATLAGLVLVGYLGYADQNNGLRSEWEISDQYFFVVDRAGVFRPKCNVFRITECRFASEKFISQYQF